MANFREFDIVICDRKEAERNEELGITGGEDQQITKVAIDLNRVESFHKTWVEYEEKNIIATHIGLQSGDNYAVLMKYEDFKGLMKD